MIAYIIINIDTHVSLGLSILTTGDVFSFQSSMTFIHWQTTVSKRVLLFLQILLRCRNKNLHMGCQLILT